MLLEKKYAKKGNTWHFLCLVLVFFLLFQSNNQHFVNIFARESNEKKERNSTEKESEEEKVEIQNKIGKLKKVKRQQFYFFSFAGDLSTNFSLPSFFTRLFFKINDLGYLLFMPNFLANLPLYLQFHALVFYEIA